MIQQRLADAVSMDLPAVVRRRSHLPQIPKQAYAVIGMRRAGKTYFMYQTMKRYIEQGIIRSRLVYFYFEDVRLAELTVKDLHWITDEYFAMFPKNRPGRMYFSFNNKIPGNRIRLPGIQRLRVIPSITSPDLSGLFRPYT